MSVEAHSGRVSVPRRSVPASARRLGSADSGGAFGGKRDAGLLSDGETLECSVHGLSQRSRRGRFHQQDGIT